VIILHVSAKYQTQVAVVRTHSITVLHIYYLGNSCSDAFIGLRQSGGIAQAGAVPILLLY